MSDEQAHEPGEATYAEYFHPARPRSLRYRTRVTQPFERHSVRKDGQPDGTNPVYVSWLLSQSMLADANTISRQFSGQANMWQNPFANPAPRQAVESASVWFTAYPISLITRPGQSFLAALGDEELWKAFSTIGINAVHTGPVKRAGGLAGWRETPSIDGHFDRIGTEIDPAFGTESEFRAMVGMATWHGGSVIDDVVPGHTGKGADFRLAEMKHADYPGIYHMVEIDPEDWGLLPEVPPGHDSVNLDVAHEEAVARAGYIIGRLQRVIFYAEGVKETNWSATAPVVGVDGTPRRWVYLHYFKEGQPSINWLDPSFAGMRLVMGDVLHSLADLGASALRLDANGFLGVERRSDGTPAWSEGHPLSEAANHLIASIVRKVGGFTFQELNLTMDDIRATGEAGADLSYDFATRPGYQHALATGDTEFLRLCLRTSLDVGVDPASLVHALQNHDELTYELLHWSHGHRDDPFPYQGAERTGSEVGDSVRRDLCRHLTGDAAPYNLVFTTNGIACTTATVIAAALGITELAAIDEVATARIRDAHLLLAMYNALQPGVFALSGWDLCGMLTLPPESVADLLESGDTRWINRPAHDLMGTNPRATRSSAGIPRGTSLYGTLPEQLDDDTSFARRLQAVLEVRDRHRIAVGRQVDVPDVSHRGMLVMVHRLGPDDAADLQLTVLNFANEAISGTVRSEHLLPGCEVVDLFTDAVVGTVDDLLSFHVELAAHRGTALLVRRPEEVAVPAAVPPAAGRPAGRSATGGAR